MYYKTKAIFLGSAAATVEVTDLTVPDMELALTKIDSYLRRSLIILSTIPLCFLRFDFRPGIWCFADFVHPPKPFTSPAVSLPYSSPFILYVFIYIKCKILKTEAMQRFRMQSIQYKLETKFHFENSENYLGSSIEPWKIKCQIVFGKITFKTLETLLNKAFEMSLT